MESKRPDPSSPPPPSSGPSSSSPSSPVPELCPWCHQKNRTRDRSGNLLPGCCKSHSVAITQREEGHQGPAGLVFVCSDPETKHRYVLLAHEHRRDGKEIARDVLGWFGGLAETSEDLKTTAAREAFEETLGIFGTADFLLATLYDTASCVPVTPRTFALSLGELTQNQRFCICQEFHKAREKAVKKCNLEVLSLRFVSLLSLACFLREKTPVCVQDEAGGFFTLRTHFETSFARALADREGVLSRVCDEEGPFSLRALPLSVPSAPLRHGGALRDYEPTRAICPYFVIGWCHNGPTCAKWHPQEPKL